MAMSARHPPLAAKPDQAHRQPVRTSKRKPAKYNDTESYTLGEHFKSAFSQLSCSCSLGSL